jgi:hypothetical protein
MKYETPVSGCLVRFNATTTRWFLVTVRKTTHDRDLECDFSIVEFLDGARLQVQTSNLVPMFSYLRSRRRPLSIKREELHYRMHGTMMERLRADRIRKMQKLLTKHGLRYSPAEWGPGARIQIMCDDSFLGPAQGGDKEESEYRTLLPKWLAAHNLPPGSRDPLGFQSQAEELADQFLPGLTVFTNRIGYYGLIAWAIRELNSGAVDLPHGINRREQFHRIERTLALCEFISHGMEEKACRLLGQRSKSEVLQSSTNNRFGVPSRILKNQESTGALRLYATSMISNGFAVSCPELAADGMLPFELTDLGTRLAREFEKRLPGGFLAFALSDKTKDREELRAWGARICFASLGGYGYKTPLLEGLLLGNSQPAESRYRTVRLLFRRGLLDSYTQTARASRDVVSEEDALSEDVVTEADRLGNAQILLKFYAESTTPENRALQTAAVFELLSIANTAIFAHAMHAIQESGRIKIGTLVQGIVESGKYGRLWMKPVMEAVKKVSRVDELLTALWLAQDGEKTATLAAVGGLLLARVANGEPFRTVAPDLAGSPALMLQECVSASSPLTESFGKLFDAMVARHADVSQGKNRQRWCYREGDELVRDDIRPLAVGWHSMRFPQLYSLCRDLSLTKGDLKHGD